MGRLGLARPMRRSCVSLAASAALAATGLLADPASTPAAAAVQLEVKAFSGEPAPGGAPDLIFNGFGNAVINEAGEVAFLAYLTDTQFQISASGIFGPDAAGDLTAVAFDFDPVPDLPPGTEFRFGSTYYPRLNDAGQIAFYAGLAGTGGPGEGIWRWSAESGIERVVLTGDPVPDAGPDIAVVIVGYGLTLPAITANGNVAFSGVIANADYTVSGWALFSADTVGIPTLAASEGMSVPDPPGAVLQFLGIPSSAEGMLSFSASFEGPGVIVAQNDSGAFTWDAAYGIALRYRAGEPAPEMPPGVVIASDSSSTFPNSAGDIAFLTRLAGEGVTEDNDSALYAPDASGDLVLLAREGFPAPGTEADSVFQDLIGNSAVVINASGKVAFLAGLSGPSVSAANEFGTWLFDPSTGSTQLRVRMGDPAPELPGLTLGAIFGPIVNDGGDLVFEARLEGPGVTPETEGAIFALSSDGPAQLVVREGDLAEFGPGDFRSLLGLSMLDGATSDAPGVGQLTNSGKLVFNAYTPEGTSAILVATLPEPHAASGLGAGAVLLELMRRARRRSHLARARKRRGDAARCADTCASAIDADSIS